MLVRPDGHILAVAAEATPAALNALGTALSSYLATPLQGAA